MSSGVGGIAVREVNVEVRKTKTQKPEKPRNKRSPYNYFLDSYKDLMRKRASANPNSEKLTHVELSKQCMDIWKSLEDPKKVKYVQMAELDKKRYDTEMAAIDSGYVAGGSGGKKRKRSSKEKDPNEPKRPLTAFFVFMGERRSEIVAKNPEMKAGDVAKQIGTMWKSLTDEERGVYMKTAASLKADYDKKLVEYKLTINAGEDKEN